MKRSVLIFSMLALVNTVVFANNKLLSFLTRDVDEFINQVVLGNSDQQSFRIYFDRLIEKMKTSNDQKKRATRQYIYQVAWNNLEKKHADWHGEINLFFTDARYTMDESFDAVRGHIRRFLTWYGAYEEYLTVKLLAQQEVTQQSVLSREPEKIVQEMHIDGLWDSFKSYAQKVKNKVVSWFGLVAPVTHA